MQAVQLQRTGGPEVLALVELPEPRPGPGQIRVRAEAIGVGKPDALIRQGSYKWMPPLPAVPGNEMAGVIDALGDGVVAGSALRIGQRVLVSSRELPQRGGCYAQAICIPAAAAYVLPDSIRPEDAVTLPNYQLAGALLYESGCVRPRSILLHGGAGGVATAAQQLARTDGIQVISLVSSQAKRDFALAAGATDVLVRGEQDLKAAVLGLTDGRGVDMVLDHVAGPGFTANLELLAPLGTLLSYNALAGLPGDVFAELRRHLGRSLGVRCYSIHTLDGDPPKRRALMERAIGLMAAGRLRPAPAVVWPLAQAREVHALLDAGETLGKMVLQP
jgi:NADPH2:quinone reductase